MVFGFMTYYLVSYYQNGQTRRNGDPCGVGKSQREEAAAPLRTRALLPLVQSVQQVRLIESEKEKTKIKLRLDFINTAGSDLTPACTPT